MLDWNDKESIEKHEKSLQFQLNATRKIGLPERYRILRKEYKKFQKEKRKMEKEKVIVHTPAVLAFTVPILLAILGIAINAGFHKYCDHVENIELINQGYTEIDQYYDDGRKLFRKAIEQEVK